MKFSQLQAFQQHLAQATPASVYLILAKDEYERKSGMNAVLSFLQKDSDTEYSVSQGESVTPGSLGDALNTMPMFAKTKLLAIHEADKLPKAAFNLLEEYCLRPSPFIRLAMDASSVTRSTKFYKNIEKAGVILDIPELKPWEKEREIAGKIRMMVEEEGIQIEPAACQELVAHLGTDQALLHQEIEKLVCYLGDRTLITVPDVLAISTSVNVNNIWQLSDAIFQRNSANALGMARALIEDGLAVFSLLRQLRSQFQTKLHICSLVVSGASPGDIQAKFPYMKGRILQSNMELAQSYGLESLKNGILSIDESELKAKNSSLDHKFITDLLIAKLTT